MISVFFSYSHRDEELRDELELHLSMLKNQKIIDTWHDRRIGAGKELDDSINQELESADIILLLVSSYFLASNYCYAIEMRRAMERHEEKSAKVIPVILHPCDWHPAPFGKLTAVPSEGKAVSKFPNMHDAFLDITKAIRASAEEIIASKAVSLTNDHESEIFTANESVKPSRVLPRSSNLRVRKEYTDRDKDAFLEETYEYISSFFDGSLVELSERNSEIQTRYRRIDTNHFTAHAYRDGKAVAQCKIWLGGRSSFPNGIAYSIDTNSSDNSMNESMSVDSDGHSLHLKPLGMANLSRDSSEAQLSKQGAAEYFWELFMRPMQY